MSASLEDLVRVGSYGNYPGNYGTHCLHVCFGPVTVWYSYRTPVAFHVMGHRKVVRCNSWGPTTGKHLRAIDDGAKRERVEDAEFDRLFQEQCGPLFEALVFAIEHPELLQRAALEQIGDKSREASA